MKILSFILSIYLFSLAIMPCGDVAHDHDTHLSSDHIAQGASHDHDGSDESDTCSPFCVCVCCGVVYNLEFNTIILPELAVQMDKKFPSFASDLNSNDFIFIWKPPKIS